ncbi:MAG: ABC transporter ATP-binding protein [Anaerolineales bacterium]|nr:ABC transporter ATP-binding protein [Anaerolineales bacterium]
MEANGDVLVRVVDLKKYFPIPGNWLLGRKPGMVRSVDGVSFEIRRGETLGLVGESGCGKSTTGRAILQLHKPTSGQVYFEGRDLTKLNAEELRRLRPKMQMIFQDSYSSLNPRHSVGKIVTEPQLLHGLLKPAQAKDRAAELLEMVGLNPAFATRFPHEFSGGQRQRINIARALSLNPSFVVCDEPISALDVSIQAQIINLLQDLQERLGLTYLFIAHDLNMVRYLSTRIAVMYLGKVVELADRERLFIHPYHPYTQSLISAVPVPSPKVERGRKRILLQGEVPSPANPPQGCVFNTRCPLAQRICFEETPAYREVEPGHFAACHLIDDKGSHKIPMAAGR